MNELAAKIEAILFLTTRPVSFSKLAKMLEADGSAVRGAIEALAASRNTAESGIHVISTDGAVELGTNPAFADLLGSMTKEETESELTRPQLETLTIIAYRGPVTKPEVEHIRGVNCSIILRNLLMRGLIIEHEDKVKLQPVYTISSELLRKLGAHGVEELPDYEDLHKNAKIGQLLSSLEDGE